MTVGRGCATDSRVAPSVHLATNMLMALTLPLEDEDSPELGEVPWSYKYHELSANCDCLFIVFDSIDNFLHITNSNSDISSKFNPLLELWKPIQGK